ncbi:unnamed protein product [Linum tenue]|uniref:Holocarboxylase synthetase n=1 Tax=Linum tenue TaxID=586396 RepID=A0AAV0RJD8_9ROSI|nr:unnamed protein product [Linum tenue]
MGKKRKSVATSLDEVDRTMYTTFCSAASSLTQLYTQAMNHQKLTFQAGERHGLEKLYQWIWRQQEAGSRVATSDVLNYIQNELDYCGEEPSMSPRAQPQNIQPPMQSLSSGFLNSSISSGSSGPTSVSQVSRNEHCDQQSKNSVFSNALSSPVRRNLQNYHIAQGGGYYPAGAAAPPPGNGPRNNDSTFLQQQNRDTHSNDSSMDI